MVHLTVSLARGIAFFKLFFDAGVNLDEPYALLSEAFQQNFDKEKCVALPFSLLALSFPHHYP